MSNDGDEANPLTTLRSRARRARRRASRSAGRVYGSVGASPAPCSASVRPGWMCSSVCVITLVPAETITQLPTSNMAAGTSAAGPINDCRTGKQKQPTLYPDPLSIRNARSATGLRRE